MTVRVGVIGAGGRMANEACRAIGAADDLALVAAVGRSSAGTALRDLVHDIDSDLTVAGDLAALTEARVDVAVDLTVPDVVLDNTLWCVTHGVHVVVGTSGLGDAGLERLRSAVAEGGANVFVAPNFAIGAVLMMRFAREAARHLPHVEIVELHHDRKADAPSGTAMRTAELIAAARSEAPDTVGGETVPGARGAEHGGIRIHAVRLPGLVAHQEVIFGGTGQTLSIRHDSVDRSSFMPGLLLAVRRVAGLDGLVIGLEELLEG